MFHVPAHKQTDPAKQPGQVVGNEPLHAGQQASKGRLYLEKETGATVWEPAGWVDAAVARK